MMLTVFTIAIYIRLNAAATECVKTRNVDLELMIEGCQHTAQMVSDIIQRDPCPIRQVS